MKKIITLFGILLSIGIQAQDYCNTLATDSGTVNDIILKEDSACGAIVPGLHSMTIQQFVNFYQRRFGLFGMPASDTNLFLATKADLAASLGIDTGTYKAASSVYNTNILIYDSVISRVQLKDSNTNKKGYVTPHAQAVILGSYLTIADSSFMSSKTFMESYVAQHSGSGGLTATDSSGGSSHITGSSQFLTNYSGAVLGGNTNQTTFILGSYTGYDVVLQSGTNYIFRIANPANNNNGISIGLDAGGNEYNRVPAANSVAIGINALPNGYNGVATNDISIGAYSSTSNGMNNSVVGIYSEFLASINESSIASLGAYSLYNNNGNKCVGIGDSAGYNNITGAYNIYLGYAAGRSNKSLSNQIYLGDSTGVWTPKLLKTSAELTGQGSAPTLVAGAGAGSSPTVSDTGSQIGGIIVVTTGTVAASGIIVTCTYANAFPNGSSVILESANINTDGLVGSVNINTTCSKSQFNIIGTANLSSATTYAWYYTISGH